MHTKIRKNLHGYQIPHLSVTFAYQRCLIDFEIRNRSLFEVRTIDIGHNIDITDELIDIIFM